MGRQGKEFGMGMHHCGNGNQPVEGTVCRVVPKKAFNWNCADRGKLGMHDSRNGNQ